MVAPIALAPGLKFSGRLIFEGSLPRPPDVASIMPVLAAVREGPSMTGLSRTVNRDDSFSYVVVPGTYRIGSTFWQRTPTTGWILKSVVANGTDITDITFDISPTSRMENVLVTFTDQRSGLSGTLQDAAGRPAAEYVLIVFAAEPRAWLPSARRTRYTKPNSDGRFVVEDLPAGEYLLCALVDIEDGQWNDPSFLAEIAATTPMKLTIAEGEKKVLNVQVREP
jgi:hypothetical protein